MLHRPPFRGALVYALLTSIYDWARWDSQDRGEVNGMAGWVLTESQNEEKTHKLPEGCIVIHHWIENAILKVSTTQM